MRLCRQAYNYVVNKSSQWRDKEVIEISLRPGVRGIYSGAHC